MKKIKYFLILLVSIISIAGASTALAAPIMISRFLSSGSGNGQIMNPLYIAQDTSGNIFVADFSNNRVQKIDSNGNYISQFGTAGNGNGQFNGPVGIAVSSSGNIYVSDRGNNRVQIFDSAGNYISQFGTAGSGNSQFNEPEAILINSDGTLYITDRQNHRVQKFDANGNYISQFGSLGSGNGQFNWVEGITSDSSGNLYTTEFINNRVQKFDANGNYISQFGTAGNGNGQFNYPIGISIEPSTNNIWVSDALNHRVQKFDANGNYISQFGTFGSGLGQFYTPAGSFFNSLGYFIIVDNDNWNIQVFGDKPPVVTGSVGSTPSTSPTITGTCIDGTTVTIFIDGSSVLPTTTCSGGTFSVAVSTTITQHTITATQTDLNGSTSSQSSPFIINDSTPPVLSNITIASNNTNTSYATTGNTITLSFTSDDVITGQNITIAGQAVTATCTGTGPVTCTATLTVTGAIPTTDGIVPFFLKVTSAGGTNTPVTATTNGSSVTVDRVAPTITPTATPINATNVAAYTATGSCTLNGDIVTITITGATPATQTAPCTGGTYAVGPFNVTALPNGTVSITASIADAAGNTASSTYMEQKNTTLLTITNIHIQSNNTNPSFAQNGDVVTVSYTTNSVPIGGSLSINGSPVVLSSGNCTGTGPYVCSGGFIVSSTQPVSDGLISFSGQIQTVLGTTTINTTTDGSSVYIRSLPTGNSGGGILTPWTPTTPTGGNTTTCPNGGSYQNNCVITTTTTPSTNTLPTTGTGTTYISPVDNQVYQCTPFTTYLRLNSTTNNQSQVKLWQAFLNKHMGENLPLTGYYGNLTYTAIKRFQSKYASDVLTPWGLTTPTGWTYQSTRAKGNQVLGCTEGKVTLDNGATINLK